MKPIQSMAKKIVKKLNPFTLSLALWISLSQVSYASTAAGDAMPWTGPLQKIMESISGPVAKILAVIVIVMAGLGLAFGESGSGVRRLLQIVLGLAIAFGAASIVSSLFTTSGGVVF